MSRVRATALVSGGKDSVYSAHLAECQGWEVRELLTIAPSDPESMMFHTPNLDLVALQAASWGKEHRNVPVEARGVAAEAAALEQALRSVDTDWIVVGAIASTYQYSRVLRLADRLGRHVFAPLWGKPGLRVVQEEVGAGLDIRFVHLAAEGLPPGWLGERLDANVVRALEAGMGSTRAYHPAGEGGEYETLVVDAPFFRQRLEIVGSDVVTGAGTSSLRIREARLAPKGAIAPPTPAADRP